MDNEVIPDRKVQTIGRLIFYAGFQIPHLGGVNFVDALQDRVEVGSSQSHCAGGFELELVIEKGVSAVYY